MKALLFIILLNFCVGLWPPYRLIANEVITPFQYEFFIDHTNSIRYLAVLAKDFTKLCFYKFKHESYISMQGCIQLPSMKHEPEFKFTGAGDGKSLFLTMCFERGKGTSPNNPDIHFAESFDEGKTWSPLAIIPHEIPGDVYDRYSPSITYAKETNLVWIAYRKIDYKIQCIVLNYSPLLKKFSQESNISDMIFVVHGPFIRNTYENSISKIHIVYSTKESSDVLWAYSQSSDEGKSWSVNVFNNQHAKELHSFLVDD